jgi:hypothetical protein
MSLREIDYLCPNLPLFFAFFFKPGLGELMLAAIQNLIQLRENEWSEFHRWQLRHHPLDSC